MKLTKRLAGVAMATVIALSNVFIGANINFIADAYDLSDEMKYGDCLFYYQIDEDEDGTYDYIEISNCDESATEVVIPSEIDGLPVKSIGSYAFTGCDVLTNVDIPDSVTLISIGDWSAFYYCSNLTSINVSENNENYSSINGILFDKEQTELIQYPSGKENTEYSIPDSVTEIGDYAFNCCESLTSIEIPDSVTEIGDYAFNCCESLTSIEIPDSVRSIGTSAFRACTNLASVKIPNSVRSIGESAFRACTSLTSIEIPNSVTKIGKYAFQDCTSLSSIEIPNSVTTIGKYAFQDCTSLSSIDIGAGLSSIDGFDFEEYYYLKNINVSLNNENYSSIDGVLFNKEQTELIKYPIGKENTEYSIPDSVTSIKKVHFCGA